MTVPRAGIRLDLPVSAKHPFPEAIGRFPIQLVSFFEMWNLLGGHADRFEPMDNPTQLPRFEGDRFILPVTLEYIFIERTAFLACQAGYPKCYGGILGDGEPFLYRWNISDTNRVGDLKGLRRMLVEGRVSDFGLEFSKIKTRTGFWLRPAIGS